MVVQCVMNASAIALRIVTAIMRTRNIRPAPKKDPMAAAGVLSQIAKADDAQRKHVRIGALS